ncbi:MAG: chemotaxis protein CheX [bacterium]|nr:chemotaxis protein CheX [bacterium]
MNTTTYTENVHDIALNTFEVTCFMFPMDEWEIEEDELEYPDGSTRAIVGFDGAAKGGMVINPNDVLLTAIAANMLGIDEPSQEEKEGALCEIANIICGNTVPLFAKDDKICVIKPPRIAAVDESADALFRGMFHEKVNVLLDEGIVEISIYVEQD